MLLQRIFARSFHLLIDQICIILIYDVKETYYNYEVIVMRRKTNEDLS